MSAIQDSRIVNPVADSLDSETDRPLPVLPFSTDVSLTADDARGLARAHRETAEAYEAAALTADMMEREIASNGYRASASIRRVYPTWSKEVPRSLHIMASGFNDPETECLHPNDNRTGFMADGTSLPPGWTRCAKCGQQFVNGVAVWMDT